MATEFKGANHTLAYVSNSKFGIGEYNGGVKLLFDKYTLLADLAVGDTILLGKLPAGARVLSAVLKSADLGGSCTIDLGVSSNGTEAADQDGFIAAADLSGQASHVSGSGAMLINTKFSAETQVVAYANAVSSSATGVVIYCAIQYVVG